MINAETAKEIVTKFYDTDENFKNELNNKIEDISKQINKKAHQGERVYSFTIKRKDKVFNTQEKINQLMSIIGAHGFNVTCLGSLDSIISISW